MSYIAIGCLGFLVIHLLDIVSLKRAPVVKPFVAILGFGSLVYAIVRIGLQPEKLPFSPGYVWFGGALLAISVSLLVYSLFLNLPFRETYIAKGVGGRLVTTGLYALVRHPGVHWFVLFMVSSILVSRSSLMLTAALIFIGLDIVLVFVQDRFIFDRMFAGYDLYRRGTPGLVPNRHSVNAFLNSLRQQVGAHIVAQGGTADGRNS